MYPYSANQYLEARPCAQIAPILHDVADALEFMHGQTPVVVHGNIRAANVLIRDNGQAVLADIGMNASDLTQMPHRLPASYRSIAIGQQWLAPEIILSGMKLRASTQADVYSFGMMSCELYTGGPPYGYNKNVFDMAEICKNSSERPKRPKDYRLTDYMWQIICNCWQSDPRGRPRIQEVSLQLENGIKLGWVG
ncbi:kinase-like protein [Schizophyllum commune H4-8]|uniref:kinase-like protein n=1 Tax=Schizophyllum commune (strain H4-8 / FGSC 9210) TaxID=578458 RepID=UPI00215FF906|nr:kinase-like protein [Schizophyllum commune H4-8]KAI5899949.1 kinase-like protein [Schizophyllum commune H4-8]